MLRIGLCVEVQPFWSGALPPGPAKWQELEGWGKEMAQGGTGRAGLGLGASLPTWSAEGAGGRSRDLGVRPSFSLPPLRKLCLARRLPSRPSSSCYNPETERGWPGLGGGGGVTWASGALPAPSTRLQLKLPGSCCPLSLWPLGKTLQAASWPRGRGSSLFLQGLALLLGGVISRWRFHLVLQGPRQLGLMPSWKEGLPGSPQQGAGPRSSEFGKQTRAPTSPCPVDLGGLKAWPAPGPASGIRGEQNQPREGGVSVEAECLLGKGVPEPRGRRPATPPSMEPGTGSSRVGPTGPFA